ncbi:transglutaminase-like domain-containing protein [Methylocystis heyeri]|uniref:Cro/Cl family transcriptional regulator n=1 Tax=Methylocystis heyeri TaxID=391905 RepID=A0A6B8K9I8_9HYPH|nr:transglutaminase family protein [Methylocystis heyeri]QGM44377.1 Cro/Cl family transcriptional regulator [Methylocystis heyeri]
MQNLFLSQSRYIDFDHPAVAETAARLAEGVGDETALVRRAFAFVRDEIAHSWDVRREGRPTCKASEVLLERTGFCYAKSHLLAALLRANRIPAGLCYQWLCMGDAGPPYCLHGLNAAFLKNHGWVRLDARGNKPGIDARFDPPRERLAYSLNDPGERDLPGVWAAPLADVLSVLESAESDEAVYRNLPDVRLRPL